jgi:DNA-binding CsgD family transcriptional regulator
MSASENTCQLWLSSLLECLPLAAVVADGDGGIVFANAKARNTLETDDALLIDNGRIRLRCRTLNPRFCELFGSSVRSADRMMAMKVPKASETGLWLVQVKSLDQSSSDAGARLVSWFDPASPPTFDWNVLEEVYGLSRSEGRVAALLAGGDDLMRAAGKLGIQLDTARTHLKSTFRKMHLHRQQELVRVTTMLSFFC